MNLQLPVPISTYLSVPDATSLHTSLPKKQAAKTFSGKDPAKDVFSIMHSYFKTFGNYLLCTKYLYKYAYCSAEKRAKKKYLYYTAQIRKALLYVIIKSLGLCNKVTAIFN